MKNPVVPFPALLACAAFCMTGSLWAQHDITPVDVAEGGRLYRVNCVVCHGAEGDGIPGIDLGHGRFRRASTDDQIANIIRTGIAGTAMPPNNFSDFQSLMIVAYLRSLAVDPASNISTGNISQGKAIFEGKGNCQSCHRVRGKGARNGPDLSDIGLLRRAPELERSLLDPSAEILTQNRKVRAVGKNGETVTGTLLNEDTFYVQLLDSSEKLRNLPRATLRDVVFEKVSPMPSFRDKLTRQELTNLVSYLVSLKGVQLTAGVQLPSDAVPEIGTAVTSKRLLNAAQEPQNWLTYSGTYLSQRYSLLSQVTPANVKNLEQQWVFQSRSLEKFEASPLIVDGILYTVQAPNDVVALDAATGKIFWIYSYVPSPEARVCCGRINRGLAILGDTLYMGTIDGHVVAVDAKSGHPIWDAAVAKPESGYSIMHAPLVVKDKVIIGVAGGEFGIRGFLAAYDAKTGREAWRFNTIPGPGEPGHETWDGDSWMHGGGSVWVTGSYDADTNLTFWGIGNPGPDWNGDVRAGANLYADSVVALDADTGKLKWHFQFSPHDDFDYDSVQVPVLAEMPYRGTTRKVLLWGNRNGFFYTIDRLNGEFLSGKAFAKQTWAKGLDDSGHPVRIPEAVPSRKGTLTYPGVQGATNWYSPSYSPHTGLFYIPTWENYGSTYTTQPAEYNEGRRYTAGAPVSTVPSLRASQIVTRSEDEGYGAVRAIDPKTGDLKWEFKMTDVTTSGILTTATDLLFTGGREGYFFALDARTGNLLWKASTGGEIANGPVTYSVAGRQYVTIASGNSLVTYALKP